MSAMLPLAISAALMIPITFCASLPPWPMLKAAELKSCKRLNMFPMPRVPLGVRTFST
jgi:hypothetical protein